MLVSVDLEQLECVGYGEFDYCAHICMFIESHLDPGFLSTGKESCGNGPVSSSNVHAAQSALENSR